MAIHALAIYSHCIHWLTMPLLKSHIRSTDIVIVTHMLHVCFPHKTVLLINQFEPTTTPCVFLPKQLSILFMEEWKPFSIIG